MVSMTVLVFELLHPPCGYRTNIGQRVAHNLVHSPLATPHLCADASPRRDVEIANRLIKLFYYMRVPRCPAVPQLLA
jgi:hypothetical protein